MANFFSGLFRAASGGAPVQTAAPYTTQLARSNDIPPAGGMLVGRWKFPSGTATFQQPNTPPPTPVAGFKGIAPDPSIVPKQKRIVPLLSPAPASSPTQAL